MERISSTSGTSASGSKSTLQQPSPPQRSVETRSRPRSRTAASFVNSLAPVMSRENSQEDIHVTASSQNIQGVTEEPQPEHGVEAASMASSTIYPQPGSPTRLTPTKPTGRKASKSVSMTRPPVSFKRTQSYHNNASSPKQNAQAGPSSPLPNLLASPSNANPRIGLKRRTSTPLVVRLQLDEDAGEASLPQSATVSPVDTGSLRGKGKGKMVETRARSTSTSLVAPPVYVETVTPPSNAPPHRQPSPFRPHLQLPIQPWQGGIYVTPASPDELPPSSPTSSTSRAVSILDRAYNVSESSLLRLVNWARPSHSVSHNRRQSDSDSEKGLSEEELDSADFTETATTSTGRTSVDSINLGTHALQGKGSKYWGLAEDEDDGYFSLPPTPPNEKVESGTSHPTYFEDQSAFASLPTPALSAHSLSKLNRRVKRSAARNTNADVSSSLGWLKHLLSFGSGTKTGEVIRELGWTVSILAGSFVVSAVIVLWLLRGLPITQLKSLPTSTTDLQLLSAEIRAYMSSSSSGWWHTIMVITIVGCWKHAFSVPGAVVLNILVGSILEPLSALALLTFITATGSLGSYSLSRPLAPLIAVLFPKPLALVRAALAPESIPAPPFSTADASGSDGITPIQISSDPTSIPIGAESTSSPSQVWRRLLIMRAMGFVPWSGMNVACGVVGVNRMTFWLTTAAGSASWSYVTASVGNILSRLALPQSTSTSHTDDLQSSGAAAGGESLTSLLRDPTLIAKLVFLSILTLLPVIIKRRRPAPTVASTTSIALQPISTTGLGSEKALNPALQHLISPDSPPLSPVTQSLGAFAPTPAAFDLLSFGRTAARQGGRVVSMAGRGAGEGIGRVFGALRG